MAKLKALTPDFISAPAPAPAKVSPRYRGTNPDPQVALENALTDAKTALRKERQRHSRVEDLLMAHVETLQTQVKDLRQLYFSTIPVPTGTKEN